MMATRTHWLPVAGVVTNTNALLGRGGFVGMKTGSDQAAGGCFMFRSGALIGVVLGQRGPDLIDAGLDSAMQLVDRLRA
jgi:D-alanyl-D-alanine carboxypeptidase (penicillin-binding protein 5/6)